MFSFSRDDSNSQEKLKTILMQSFLAGQKIIMVFSKVANVPKPKTMVMQNFGGDKKIIMLFSKVANSLEMVHFFFFPFFLSSHTMTFLSFFLFQTAASKTVPVSEWSPSSDNTIHRLGKFFVLLCVFLCLLDLRYVITVFLNLELSIASLERSGDKAKASFRQLAV